MTKTMTRLLGSTIATYRGESFKSQIPLGSKTNRVIEDHSAEAEQSLCLGVAPMSASIELLGVKG